MGLSYCTIIARNYAAQARVLAQSLLAVDPAAQCSVLVLDAVRGGDLGVLDPALEAFEVLTPEDLDIDGFEEMSAIYSAIELSTAVKPWLLETLLERPESDRVVYLDPDIQVFTRLDDLDRTLDDFSIVLTPHVLEPMIRDECRPNENDILLSGIYNLGFIAVRRGETTEKLLGYWKERLRSDCRFDPPRGFFVDQRWIDFVPGLFDDCCILRDPGYNVAYWNLPHRDVRLVDGSYVVNERPLQFFHYSGYSPERPDTISQHQSRVDLADYPVVNDLCDAYGAALLKHEYIEGKGIGYGYGALADGTEVSALMRDLMRRAIAEGALTASVFTNDGTEQVSAWVNGGGDQDGANSRLSVAKRAVDEDLARMFPPLEGDGPSYQARLEAFHAKHRVPEEPVTPPEPAGVATPLAEDLALTEPQPAPPVNGATAASGRWGVNVLGYLRGELGVGEAARQMIRALDAAGIPVAPLGLSVDVTRMGHSFGHLETPHGPYSVNLICANADATPHVAEQVGVERLRSRPCVGFWFWEVNSFPAEWQGSFDYLDEVWVATSHIAEAVAPVSPLPVLKVRMPVVPVPPSLATRSSLGLPEEFCFLFVFDYNSIFERKNPLGLIEAFKRAFPTGTEPALVVKSINGHRHPDERERLVTAAAEHPGVHLIEGHVAAADKSAMIANCDCYVSLHRSEGFGLTLAEAMYFGRPTIGTGYSGNLDFMTASNTYLVDYTLNRIGAGSEPYPADGEWADPDVAHAARLMREVFEDPEEADERGRRAAAEIRTTHSPEAAGRLLQRRLATIGAAQA